MTGFWRSRLVIDWMIASTRLNCFSFRGGRSNSGAGELVQAGDHVQDHGMEPIFLICCSWPRKSSRVNCPLTIFFCKCSGLLLVETSWVCSISVSMSPMPRMREASRSG